MSRFAAPIAACAALFIAIVFAGCAPRLPTYPWTDAPTALAAMAARADSIHTFSSPATIHLKRRDGYTVSLDAAVAAKIPGWLRIRAWKFGNAVMDVTVTPEGVWVLRQDHGKVAETAAPPTAGPDRLAEIWTLFTGRFFDDPGVRVVDAGGPRFTIERSLGDDGATVSCEVDRATLTARSFVIKEPGSTVRLTLTLERYRPLGTTPWPMRLIAEIARPPEEAHARPDDPARVTVTFDEPEINPDLPPAAFLPPRRAVKQP